MKAIRKSDGKIIDVEVHGWRGEQAISYHTNFKQFYKPEELDFNISQEPEQSEQSSSFDWQSFRNQAAKDILCAIINSPSINSFKDDNDERVPFDKNSACKVAIEYSNELIKQLKEKEEK